MISPVLKWNIWRYERRCHWHLRCRKWPYPELPWLCLATERVTYVCLYTFQNWNPFKLENKKWPTSDIYLADDISKCIFLDDKVCILIQAVQFDVYFLWSSLRKGGQPVTEPIVIKIADDKGANRPQWNDILRQNIYSMSHIVCWGLIYNSFCCDHSVRWSIYPYPPGLLQCHKTLHFVA